MYRSCNIRGPDARLSSILRLTLESRKYKGNEPAILLQLYMKISKCVIEIKDMILYRRIILIIIYIYILFV